MTTRPFPLTDEEGPTAAELLDELQPDLLLSTERAGRNRNGLYYNMRGRDYGMGRARVDDVFDAGRERGIPVVAIGDGGNEIGMGNVADEVQAHVPFGAEGSCPCGGGIGAVSTADVLVTAAVSNWGCTAIAAAMAARTGDRRLLHTPAAERRLLDVMTAEGLINSTNGIIDDRVDGMDAETHLAVAQLCSAIAGW
ncbi:MAG: glutamate cyclase domain-containing protein [Actinomycetota bacterium]